MFVSNKTHIAVLFLTLFSTIPAFSQFYNKHIEAKIDVENNNEFIKITGTALNKTEINASLRYTLSVFRTDPESKNISKNEQDGRFVLKPSEKKSLSTTTINTDDPDKIIILLLIYNIDDTILGKDRIVFNDDGKQEIDMDPEVKQTTLIAENPVSESDVENSNKDGVVLRGIVVEDTKTKPGRDFYDMFYSEYSLNNINGEQVILIKEVLALGTNTKLEVQVDNKTIFEFFARPNNEYLKAMTDYAIRRVHQYFQRLKNQNEMIRHY